MKWLMFLVAAWGVVILTSVVKSNLPANYWFDPISLVVADAEVGTCPEIEYQRTIRRPFSGTWLATLQRQNQAGTFTRYRIWRGESDYRPENGLPDALFRNLGWWFETDDCNWPAGVYRVLTTWTIHPDVGGPRVTRITSNVFTIH